MTPRHGRGRRGPGRAPGAPQPARRLDARKWGLLRLGALALLLAAWVTVGRLQAAHPGLVVGEGTPGAPRASSSLATGSAPAARPPALSRADRDPGREGPMPSSGTGPGPHIGRYGGHSGRLPATLSLAAAEPTTRIDSVESNPTLQVWVPSVRVTARGTTIFARLIDDPAAPAAVSPPLVAIAAADQEPSDFLPMQAAESGAAGPAHEFRKGFVPPPAPAAPGSLLPPRQFRYVVVVKGARGGEPFERRAGGLFFVHDPRAQLDPASAQVAPEAGDLVLRVDAQVERAGTYYVYAELWGGRGDGQQAIAFARDRLTGVPAGVRSIELRFGGRILAGAHVDGPYTVRNLRLQQVDTHPAHEADPIAALPATPAWPSARFH